MKLFAISSILALTQVRSVFATQIDGLVVFGDDLSVSGGGQNTSDPRDNSHGPQRVVPKSSYGEVWIDYLKEYFDLKNYANMAVPRATASTSNPEDFVGDQGGGLESQVSRYQKEFLTRDVMTDSELGIMWFGKNDFSPIPTLPKVKAYNQAIHNGIEFLLLNDNLTNFFVPYYNIKDRLMAADEVSLPTMLKQMNVKYNHMGLKAVAWDIKSAIEEGLEDKESSLLATYEKIFGQTWQNEFPKTCWDAYLPVSRTTRKCSKFIKLATTESSQLKSQLHAAIANLAYDEIVEQFGC